MRLGRLRLPLLCVLAMLACLAGCRRIEQRVDETPDSLRSTDQQPADPNLLFGNPSDATADPANPDNYLLVKRSFVVSYNNQKGTANWVAWRTTLNDLGQTRQRPAFAPDQTLPSGFTIIKPTDYTGSGYDRGHLLPNADRLADPELNAETFLMTNIVPQAAGLNQFTWEKLESYSRRLARRGSDVYTIAGVYGQERRLRRRITVPTNCWKIIVVLPPGGTNGDVNGQTRVIAVDMPNVESIAKDRWQKYKTTVRSLEERTGYNFFSNLPPELQDVLEMRVDQE